MGRMMAAEQVMRREQQLGKNLIREEKTKATRTVTAHVLLSALECIMPASSKARNDNLGHTAGLAAWAA